MSDPNTASPINPLPWVVWALALPIIAMEIVMNLGERGIVGGASSIGWRTEAIQRFGYLPDMIRYMWANDYWPLEGVWRFVSYAFVHGSFTHALFAAVLLLALGKMVAEVFRWWAVLLVFFAAGSLGAMAYTLVPGNRFVLIGAYPAVYGLIGAFTFLIWVRLAATGSNQARAFTLIGMLLSMQLLFGLLFGGGYEWVADITGFATGFLLSFLVSPGGFGRVRERLRHR